MEIKKWLGLRNTDSPERLKLGECVTALDVDVNNSGKLLSRRGTTKRSSTALHSLYSNHLVSIAVAGTNLVAIEPDWSLTTLKALTSTARLSAETVGDVLYYSNGTDTGRLVGRAPSCWGVKPPMGQPQATASTGGLPPGRYLYAFTFVRRDGHESGTGISGSIDLTDTGGISFSSMEVSSNSEVTDKILYLSSTNGEVLFVAGMMSNNTTSYTYGGNGNDLTIPLVTQFAQNPPAGHLVRNYNGIMYVVTDTGVFYSDPYSFELFRKGTNFQQFPGHVVMFEAANGGLYVGTVDAGGGDDAEGRGAVWFLSGDRPDKLKSQQLFDYGVIEGTVVVTDAAYFETPIEGQQAGEQARPIVVWTTRHGTCVGRDDGNCQNLTETKYSFVSSQRGAAFIRQDRGYNTLITTLQGTGARTNTYVLP